MLVYSYICIKIYNIYYNHESFLIDQAKSSEHVGNDLQGKECTLVPSSSPMSSSGASGSSGVSSSSASASNSVTSSSASSSSNVTSSSASSSNSVTSASSSVSNSAHINTNSHLLKVLSACLYSIEEQVYLKGTSQRPGWLTGRRRFKWRETLRRCFFVLFF
jgi:hypothetical protein